MDKNNYIVEYWSQIQSGAETVGRWIFLLYTMVTQKLAKGEYFFDPKKANKALYFIENYCHHHQGRNDLLKLELWQKATVHLIFGIVDLDGLRIFREVFLVVGRKNGKTLFVAAIIAYIAYIDGEYGSEIYCLAPKLDQSNLVYNAFYQMTQSENDLKDITHKRRSDIYIPQLNTFVSRLAFNFKKSDGFNPLLVVNDEVASWRGSAGLQQYEVMTSAQGARVEPLVISITTAGYENDGIFDELTGRSTAVLNGTSKEQRLLPIIYEIDDLEKWDDINELKKANPNMGVSVKESFFNDAIVIARESLSKKNEFLAKHCNKKQNSTAAAYSADMIMHTITNYTLQDFAGCYCVGGIDLSQTTDLTAASIVIERDKRLNAFTQFFMPAAKVDEMTEQDGTPYRLFVQQGLITLSGENYVDYRDMYNWWVDLVDTHKIYPLKIGYDRYSSQYLINDLKTRGFHTDDVFQGDNLTPVLQEMEGILKDKNFNIGANNQMLLSHFANVAFKHNLETRRFRPVKIHQRARIDGYVSVVDALTVRQKHHNEIGKMLENKKKRGA